MIRFGLFIFIESRLKPDEVQQFQAIREVSSRKRNADPCLSADVGHYGFSRPKFV